MKTKTILQAIAVAVIVYSCATDREDEILPSNNAQTNEVKKELILTKTQLDRVRENKSSDTLVRKQRAAYMTGLENAIISPGDVRPPKTN